LRMGFERLVLAMVLGFGLLAGGVAVAAPAAGAPEAADLGILIVGDETKATMLRDEKTLIAEITRLIVGKADSEADRDRYAHARELQVYSYHFNQAPERQHCEKKLNILAEDLLFVGIVELKDRIPRRVLYRLDRIVSARRSATDIMTRAEEMLAPESPDVQPEVKPSPAPQSSPAPQ